MLAFLFLFVFISSSCSLNNQPNKLLNHCLAELIEPLSILSNLCFVNVTIPPHSRRPQQCQQTLTSLKRNMKYCWKKAIKEKESWTASESVPKQQFELAANLTQLLNHLQDDIVVFKNQDNYKYLVEEKKKKFTRNMNKVLTFVKKLLGADYPQQEKTKSTKHLIQHKLKNRKTEKEKSETLSKPEKVLNAPAEHEKSRGLAEPPTLYLSVVPLQTAHPRLENKLESKNLLETPNVSPKPVMQMSTSHQHMNMMTASPADAQKFRSLVIVLVSILFISILICIVLVILLLKIKNKSV
jgi:hypothetical protein